MEADDEVGGAVVEDPTEETVVTGDELDVGDEAEEGEGENVVDAAKVADDDGLELETDDTGGWLVLLHLDMEPTNQPSLQLRPYPTNVSIVPREDEIHLDVSEYCGFKGPMG